MNNDNFVTTHPRTVVEYTVKCKTTTKIYSVRKLSTSIYVHHVIFFVWTLRFIDFLTLCFILFISRTFCRVSKQIFF